MAHPGVGVREAGGDGIGNSDDFAVEARTHVGHRLLDGLGAAEDLVHYAVGVLLVLVAGVVLYHSIADFVTSDAAFAERITGVINGVLFVIIVMEILRTIVAHFDNAGLQLKPFLIIGIISAVRHILTVGAQLSLGVEGGELFRHVQIELGVNAAVVLALVIGLVLVRRSEPADAREPGIAEHSTDRHRR
jgi:uncharacterized membrane protein (DUF373 family)